MWTDPKKYAWAGVALVMCLLLGAPLVVAEDDPSLGELRSQLEQLESGVTDEAGRQEFDLANEWLQEAEGLRDAGDDQAARRMTRRVDHMIDLLEVVLETNDVRTSIEHQKGALEESQSRIEQMREDIESLERQKADREEELERVRSDE